MYVYKYLFPINIIIILLYILHILLHKYLYYTYVRVCLIASFFILKYKALLYVQKDKSAQARAIFMYAISRHIF